MKEINIEINRPEKSHFSFRRSNFLGLNNYLDLKHFLNLTYLCLVICLGAFATIAGEKLNRQNFAHVKILKGSVRNHKGEQFSHGKFFELDLKSIITLNPVTVIEISGIESFPEKIIIRNHRTNKSKIFSIYNYLNKMSKSKKVNAYRQLKSALLPREYYYVCRFNGKIKIDGKLDEKAWKTAVPMPLFTDLVTGQTPRFAATCKVLWDDKNLYLGYRVEDPCIWALANTYDEQMYTGKGENNGNFIKFFADPDCDGRDYIEIHVNPLNNVMDAWLPYNWTAKYRQEVGIDDINESFLAIE